MARKCPAHDMSNESSTTKWSGKRLGAYVAIIFLAQIGFIYWLGDHAPGAQRRPRHTPALQLAGPSSRDVLDLQNPAIFALPRAESFAGLAWMPQPTPGYHELEWGEEPQWLLVSTSRLGTVFTQFTETNVVRTWQIISMPQPALLMPNTEAGYRLAQSSRLGVSPENPGVTITQAPELPSWPPRANGPNDFEFLTNSVVSAMFGADGMILSAVLLSGSGSPVADDYALSATRSIKLSHGASSPASQEPHATLRWARLIFEWHTVPATNAPPAAASTK